ncbi:MAG: pentapeptide repeat-containing protein, partial [Sedimenticola sp.]
DLSNAVMGGAILRRANVEGANFEGVELATVTMDFANFSKALNAKYPSYKTNLR